MYLHRPSCCVVVVIIASTIIFLLKFQAYSRAMQQMIFSDTIKFVARILQNYRHCLFVDVQVKGVPVPTLLVYCQAARTLFFRATNAPTIHGRCRTWFRALHRPCVVSIRARPSLATSASRLALHPYLLSRQQAYAPDYPVCMCVHVNFPTHHFKNFLSCSLQPLGTSKAPTPFSFFLSLSCIQNSSPASVSLPN